MIRSEGQIALAVDHDPVTRAALRLVPTTGATPSAKPGRCERTSDPAPTRARGADKLQPGLVAIAPRANSSRSAELGRS